MYLSTFQKEIVRKISYGEIKTIKDFVLDYDLAQVLVDIKSQEYDFSFGNVYYKVKSPAEAYNKLIDYRKVLNLLIKAELIEVEKSANLNMIFLIHENRPASVTDILNSSQKDLIIPYNEIRNFAKDFHTPQERNQKRQLWVPIFVAILTVVLSSVINYFIYTKEREVYIKNVNAFKDPIYVKVLNDIDSSTNKNRTELDSINSKKVKIFSGKEVEEE